MENKIVRNSNVQETETRSLEHKNQHKNRKNVVLMLKSRKQDR
ncbi:hypothetical protein RM616_01075 [Mammaliicoccus sciuri]|nr:hypothetical protein [Mammaliicoccus sciuri]MDT0668165.1 hypothetical protein [Mammaliicoccus sciuri]